MFKKLLPVGLLTLSFAAALCFTTGSADAQKKGWYQYTFPPRASQPAPIRTEVVVPPSPTYIYSETDPEFYFTEYTDPEYYYTTQQDPAFSAERQYRAPTYYYETYRYSAPYRPRWFWRRW